MQPIPLKKLCLTALLLLLTLQACSLPAAIQFTSPAARVEAGQVRLMTVGKNPTPTATPFQPSAPTQTPIPSPTTVVTQGPTPLPTIGVTTPTSPFPNTQPGAPLPDGVVTILVLGSDARPGGGYRTDVIMLFTINRKTGSVSVVSFPRDLYVDIPGWQTNRINTAMEVGGFNLLAATFQSNFGVRPAYYILTDFNGFKAIIGSLGGINVKVEKSLSDTCDLPWANGRGYCTIDAPATVPMNGNDALWYVRSRHSSSDFDRLRRAQEVIRAIFVKLMTLDAISRVPDLYNIYQKNVQTNLGLDQILPLVPIAQEIIKDPNQVRRFALTPQQAVPFVTPEGAMVLWPNLDSIRATVYDAVFH